MNLNLMLSELSNLAIMAFSICIAISIHEWGHAVTSNALGDPTAKMYGRMTLNPLSHMNVVGLICFAVVGIGWANPVPINESNFKHRKRDIIIVSAAGAFFNILTAIVFALIMKPFINNYAVVMVCRNVIAFNIAFAVFNLCIPMPPLDGWNILNSLFNIERFEIFGYIRQYSIMILLLLSMTGILSKILGPIQMIVTRFVYSFIYGF